jgi:hypothetical protein
MRALLLALLVGLATWGCKTTPEEIREIQAENELLRQQVNTMRQNCEYYRDIEIRPGEKPPE